MQHVEKMVLVPVSAMAGGLGHRPAAPADASTITPPLDTHLVELDREMSQLAQTSMPYDVKVKLYQDRLTKLLKGRDVKKAAMATAKPQTPAPPPTVRPGLSAAVQTAPTAHAWRNTTALDHASVLKGIGKAHQGRAQELLHYLEGPSSRLSWNTRGQLLREAGDPTEVVRGATLKKLVHYATKNTTSMPPKGWAVFQKNILASSTLPPAAIGNHKLRHQLLLLLRDQDHQDRSTLSRHKGPQSGRGLGKKYQIPQWTSQY
jgi:hypothetical protein